MGAACGSYSAIPRAVWGTRGWLPGFSSAGHSPAYPCRSCRCARCLLADGGCRWWAPAWRTGAGTRQKGPAEAGRGLLEHSRGCGEPHRGVVWPGHFRLWQPLTARLPAGTVIFVSASPMRMQTTLRYRPGWTNRAALSPAARLLRYRGHRHSPAALACRLFTAERFDPWLAPRSAGDVPGANSAAWRTATRGMFKQPAVRLRSAAP